MAYTGVTYTEKSCKNCKKKFTGMNAKVYCSADCRDETAEKRYRAGRKEVHRKALLAGRKCESCGKPLFAWSRKFCSDECRGAAGRTFSNCWKREVVLRNFPEAAGDLARLKDAWNSRSELTE